ncbi:MAG: hypothetical protein HRT40_11660, partial [Campylobacteraceae bacterium]|nr:hypothetical protein [Campylobacteraceae bacterium]
IKNGILNFSDESSCTSTSYNKILNNNYYVSFSSKNCMNNDEGKFLVKVFSSNTIYLAKIYTHPNFGYERIYKLYKQ